MAVPSKILEKKLRLRSIIFVQRTISRQELIKQSGLNERTVIRYAEELEQQQMITSETISVSRGRPGIVYHSKSENCCFIGMRLSTHQFHIACCDINSFPIAVQSINFTDNMTEAARFAAIFDVIEKFMNQFGARVPGTVALAYSVTLCDKVAIVMRVAGEFQRRYRLICEVYYNDDLSFWQIACNSGRRGPMLGIVCGSRLYATLIVDDEIVPLRPNVLKSICHLNVNPTSDLVCSCKKTGCAEAELTYGGVVHRYNKLAKQPLPPLSDMHNYKQIFYRTRSGEAQARQIIDDNCRMLRQVIAKFSEVEHFEYVGLLCGWFWMASPELLREFARYPADKPVIPSGNSNVENVFLPALYILYRTLNYQPSLN